MPERLIPERPVAPLVPAPPSVEVAPGLPARPRRSDDIPAPSSVGRKETSLVFFLAWLFFAYVGYRAVIDRHIIPADAINLMSRAFYVWHNDPAKLAAIGFNAPPLQTIGLLPFAIVKPLASSLVALPVASGFWGAVAITMVHRTLARCGMTMTLRLIATVLVALNPLWLFYAGSGMPDMIYIAALAATLYFVFTWVIEDQPRFVAAVGLCLAGLSMARFGFLWWALILTFVVAFVLASRRAGDDEREGLLITLLAPVTAALTIWVIVCAVIASDPFGWITTTPSLGGATSSPQSHPVDIGGLLEHTGVLLIGVAPVAVLAFGALVWRSFRGDRLAIGLAVVLVGGVVVTVGTAVVHDDLSLLSLRAGLPLMVMGIGAAAWLSRTDTALGVIMTFVGLIVAIPAAALVMRDYPYQNLEQAFVRGLREQKSQEGTTSIGGYQVGIRSEQRMAAFIKVLAGDRKNYVLADNSASAGVILLTGRPQAFVDRVDAGDAAFLEIVRKPWGRVRYMLVVRGYKQGSIQSVYPGAPEGRTPGLQPVFTAGPYVLLSVAARDPKVVAREAAARLSRSPLPANPSATPATPGRTP